MRHEADIAPPARGSAQGSNGRSGDGRPGPTSSAGHDGQFGTPLHNDVDRFDSGDSVETGKRLIRLSDDRGSSLADRIAARFYRLTWRTPLHALRLRGRFPLKLLGVPEDPIPGDPMAGKALRAGHFLFRGLKLPTARLDFGNLPVPPAFADYIHSFAWLRDLASAGTRASESELVIQYFTELLRRGNIELGSCHFVYLLFKSGKHHVIFL